MSNPQPVAVVPQRASLVAKFAGKYSIEPEKLLAVLKATAFKQGKDDPEVTNEQMAALLVVADQYGLNPFTKEIYAFADKHKGVVPIVGVDGWARIINDKVMLDGIEFRYSGDGEPVWIECVISRKDRSKPVVVREYLSECRRETGPWRSHERRMLRHKALIQCARVAFGFAGIYDQDEADRILEKDVTPAPVEAERGGAARLKAAVLDQPAVDKAQPQGTAEQLEKFKKKFTDCTDREVLALAKDEANLYAWSEEDRGALDAAFRARDAELGQ